MTEQSNNNPKSTGYMKRGWEYKKLSNCLSYVKNGANIKQTKGAGGIPITRIETLAGGIFNRDRLGYADVYDIGKYTSYILDDADILMSHINSKAFIGRSVIYRKQGEERIIHGMNLLRLKFFINLVNPEFANYYFKCSYFRDEVAKIRKDAVNQSSMAISDLKKISIPIPPLSEQQRIVEELDLLSSIIEKKKAQLKELDSLAQSIFYDMFGDPVTNEKGWEVIQLGSKCEVSSFKRVLVEDVVNEGIPFIRGTELMSLSNGDNSKFTMFITQEHYDKVKAISGVPKIGDLLIPSINANGNVWVLNTSEPRYYKDGRVLWVHVNKEVYSSQALKYIMHLLIKNTYSSVASGATFAELKLFVLRELNTILPPLPLQQQFAEKVEAIEHQKELIKQSIKEVETLFNSRMDYYFDR